MTGTNKNPVAEPCSEFTAMRPRWELIDALLGGTLAMRAAGERWLPKEPKEDQTSYDVRLNRSILFTAYSDTIDDLVSKPFSRPVKKEGKSIPDWLQEIIDNCDRQGTNLDQFARELFSECLNRGLTHILVDNMRTARPDGQKLTLADEQKVGVRPYFVHIRPTQLIGWRFETINGKPKLTQIRWRESTTIPDGNYGEKVIETIRVYTPTTWEIHTKNEKGEYTLSESGNHTYPDGIPLVTCYVNKTGQMTAMPPLEGLAWLNLAHYQGDSDQKNLLRFIRFALLFFSGLTQEEIEKEVVLGPGRKFSSTNPDADAKFLEHTGAGAEAGRQDLKDIEERMIAAGLDPIMSKPGNQTATGQSIDESHSQCSILAWVNSLDLALYNLFAIAGNWIGEELPDDFTVGIYKEFGLGPRAATDIDALLKSVQAGKISDKTYLIELKRRDVLSENVDVTDEIEEIAKQGPALGLLGRGDNIQGQGN